MSTMPEISVKTEEWAIISSLLNKHFPCNEVWAFGSRAQGNPKPYSDLDIAILSKEGLGLKALAALEEDFSESDLPYKVDVIDMATTQKTFQKVIRDQKVILQTGNTR